MIRSEQEPIRSETIGTTGERRIAEGDTLQTELGTRVVDALNAQVGTTPVKDLQPGRPVLLPRLPGH